MTHILGGITLADARLAGLMAGQLEHCRAFGWGAMGWNPLGEREALFTPPRIGGGSYIDPASRVTIAAARGIKRTLPSTPPEQLGLPDRYAGGQRVVGRPGRVGPSGRPTAQPATMRARRLECTGGLGRDRTRRSRPERDPPGWSGNWTRDPAYCSQDPSARSR